ncbi:MAG: hypothetical protein H6623_04510 [Bdellovibrionaceae bacterium]|nr:hypothetical protein [Pseudobdellovibrionaceae bacterium]
MFLLLNLLQPFALAEDSYWPTPNGQMCLLQPVITNGALVPLNELFTTHWKEDIKTYTETSLSTKNYIMALSQMVWHTNDTRSALLLGDLVSPIELNKVGRYALIVEAIPWFEFQQSGYFISHQIVDENCNIVDEFHLNIKNE